MIRTEYVGQMVDTAQKMIAYVGVFKTEEELMAWHKKHMESGKFSGLKLVTRKRTLIKDKPIFINTTFWLLATSTLLFALTLGMLIYDKMGG